MSTKPLSPLLSNFPLRVLSSEMDELKDKEVLVKCRTMAGVDHIIAIADWQRSSTVALFAGHVCDVHYERIHLSLNCETLGMNEPMAEVAKRLEDTDHVVQILVTDLPILRYTPSFMLPDILQLRRAYGPSSSGESW